MPRIWPCNQSSFRWRATLAALLVLTPGCFAAAHLPPGLPPAHLKAKGSAKIHIRADKLTAEPEAGEAEFSGHVRATRGDVVVTADKIKIFYNTAVNDNSGRKVDRQSIKKIIARGRVKIQFEDTVATAAKAVYTPGPAVLVLSGKNAKIVSGRNAIAGAKFILDKTAGRMTVHSGPAGRVRALIFLRQKLME